jgi:hypothetical protein
MQKTKKDINDFMSNELSKNINSVLMSEELQDIVDFHEKESNADNFSIILKIDDKEISSPVLYYKKKTNKTIMDILVSKKDLAGLILESFKYIKILIDDKELKFFNLKKNIVSYKIKLYDKNIYKVRFFIKKVGKDEF